MLTEAPGFGTQLVGVYVYTIHYIFSGQIAPAI
jgi:hypothetical protein